MKTYKKPDGSLWAFEEDDSQDHLITSDMTRISEAQADAIRNPVLPPQVPQVVSRFQARAALHLSGFLDEVETLMSAPQTDALAKIAWQDAQEFYRTSATVLSMAVLLNLSDDDLDNLFIVAAGITA